METKFFKLKYGKGYKEIQVSDENLMVALYPSEIERLYSEDEILRQALENPIGTPPLKEMVKGKKDIIILVSDITRPAPSYKMLPILVEQLNAGGVRDDQITIVFGLGNHRKHTEEEQRRLVGDKIFDRIKCIDHDSNDCVYLGQSSRGTPIEVFRRVIESDFIIGTGNLEFHYRAGYSGGNKALMPAVCSKRTVQTNHAMMIKPGTMPGRADGNPMREDIEEIGLKCGVKFILNVVVDGNKEILAAVAGHPIEAHREGCKYIDKMFKCPIIELGDIVIASSGGYPKDIDLYQAQKGLEHASYAVKDGGIIILLAECSENLGEEVFEDWMLRAKSPDDPVRWIQEEFKLGAHKAAVISMVLQKKTVFLVSEMDPSLVKEVFFEPFATVDEALEAAIMRMGNDSKIIVMPAANSTLPTLG